MERPKGTTEPRERKITGEIVYRNEMFRHHQPPRKYPEDVSDMAVQMYESEAGMYIDRGMRPAIMDLYEHYDREAENELSGSCIALAEELLKLKDPTSPMTFVDIVTDVDASEVIEKLHALRSGKLLTAEDEQLAIKSNGEYYPILDIKKHDLTLLGVGVRAWGWSGEKAVFTNGPDEQYEYAKHCLRYPSDEKSKWYQLDVSFSYRLADTNTLVETLSLTIGQRGELSLSRDVWYSEYAETGYEGHKQKQLHHVAEKDVADFVDLIAEIVGDEPISVHEAQERQYEAYLEKIVLPESLKYIQEWVANSWSGQVLYEISRERVGDVRLTKALIVPELAAEAQSALVLLVEHKRSRRNESAEGEQSEFFGKIKPWQDLIERP